MSKSNDVQTAAVLPQAMARIGWIDTMKGLLIILMVLGHTGSPLGTAIYLFHMPAFFILSGITYHGQRYRFGDYIMRQVRNVLLPTLLMNILFILFYVSMQFLGYYNIFQAGGPINLGNRLKLLAQFLGTPDFGGATWFLFVLFETTIICRIVTAIAELLNQVHFTWLGMLLLGCIGWYLIETKQVLLYNLDLALLACFFFGIGTALSQYGLLEKLDSKIIAPLSAAASVFFVFFYFSQQIPMDWPTRTFTHPFIQIVSCFTAAYICRLCAAVLDGFFPGRHLRWLGQHTYCILITHFVGFRILFGLGVLLGRLPVSYLQNLTPTGGITGHLGWLIIAALTLLLCSGFAWAAEKNPVSNYLINAKPFQDNRSKKKLRKTNG